MKIRAFISLVGVMLLFSTSVLAATIQVPEGQPTIQAAIDAALDGDTVLVAPGMYIENIDFKGKNIIVGSLFLTTGNSSYISQTVINGNQSGRVVTLMNDEPSTAVLSGFTITNGSGGETPGYFMTFGGGIRCSSNARLENLIISGNAATFGGGIFLADPGNASLVNVKVIGNTAEHGGGVCVNYSSPNFLNVIVSENTATERGGGMRFNHSSSLLRNVLVSNNNASEWGGGILFYAYDTPTLINVTITGNQTTNSNYDYSGGGMFCRYSSNPTLVNSILWDNFPQSIMFHRTGAWYGPSSITISYSNIAGGEAGIVTEVIDGEDAVVYWLEGNINSDPFFADAVNGDFHLTQFSPCKDTGTSDVSGLPVTDFEGDPRIVGPAPDMGADEFVLSYTEVNIDIKPGSDPNSINPRSKGKIPVAILSTMDFDAPVEVDTESLTFGATGNEDSLAFCNSSPEDVNDDSLDDLVCHFYTQETDFQCGDEEGILKGQTMDGMSIEGSDTVRIVPSACPKDNKKSK